MDYRTVADFLFFYYETVMMQYFSSRFAKFFTSFDLKNSEAAPVYTRTAQLRL